MISPRILRMVGAVTPALWLLGCAVTSVPQSHFYRIDAAALTPGASAASAPLLDGVLVVERFSANGLASDRPILYSEGEPLEVRQHHYHYWVEPPTDMLQEQVATYLRARKTAETVVTPELRLPPAYVVRGRVNRFERVLDKGADRALIETRLSIEEVATKRILWMDTYRAEVEAKGRQAIDIVEAFNSGVRDILTRFADDIRSQ